MNVFIRKKNLFSLFFILTVVTKVSGVNQNIITGSSPIVNRAPEEIEQYATEYEYYLDGINEGNCLANIWREDLINQCSTDHFRFKGNLLYNKIETWSQKSNYDKKETRVWVENALPPILKKEVYNSIKLIKGNTYFFNKKNDKSPVPPMEPKEIEDMKKFFTIESEHEKDLTLELKAEVIDECFKAIKDNNELANNKLKTLCMQRTRSIIIAHLTYYLLCQSCNDELYDIKYNKETAPKNISQLNKLQATYNKIHNQLREKIAEFDPDTELNKRIYDGEVHIYNQWKKTLEPANITKLMESAEQMKKLQEKNAATKEEEDRQLWEKQEEIEKRYKGQLAPRRLADIQSEDDKKKQRLESENRTKAIQEEQRQSVLKEQKKAEENKGKEEKKSDKTPYIAGASFGLICCYPIVKKNNNENKDKTVKKRELKANEKIQNKYNKLNNQIISSKTKVR